MLRSLRTVHIVAGLLTAGHLVFYSLIGIAGSLHVTSDPPAALPLREVAFETPAGLPDRELATRIARHLGLTLALPVQPAAIRRDASGVLHLDLWHANGHHVITLLPHALRVEEYRSGAARYSNVLHMTTAVFRSGDRRMNAWAWWNEFGMWGTAFTLATGMLLWLVSRPAGTLRRLHRYLALGAFPLLAVYLSSAVMLAHRSWFTTSGPLVVLHRSYGTAGGWAVALALTSLLALALAISGVLLWIRGRRLRIAGAVLLTSSALAGWCLALFMRL